MILSAQSIRIRCIWVYGERKVKKDAMIIPFHERTEIVLHDCFNYEKECIEQEWVKADEDDTGPRFSYGLSSCGYDVRIAEDIWLWPLWGRLASTIEHFNMPNDIMAEVKDKSSWARRFITVQNTVIEPGWKGYLTLELTNHRLWPKRIKAGTPIAQIVFKQLDKPTDQPYNGKYQMQKAGPQKAI